MATTVADPILLDTNILVYASVTSAPLHTQAVQAIRSFEQAGVEIWISRQILREFLAVLSRPQTFTQPIGALALTAHVRLLESRFLTADDNPRTTTALLGLIEQIPVGGRQVHDANIVATMQVYGIPRLLTHNVSDFTRYGHLVSVLPLIAAP